MKRFLNWLDHRTGYRYLLTEALYENIPGGSRWRYVFGSTLVFLFAVQVMTGLFLWMCYSPSTQTAWESVYYLQYHMGEWGILLRGIHHYAAQLMIILLVLHFLQVVIDGAYKAPREINFWIGLILLQIILGLALTGYLLPWDQKGYWATKVATEIAGSVGREVPEVAVGGTDYGHQTLTRFFALHAGVLPGLLMLFLIIHIAVFRRHGITARTRIKQVRSDQHFWPDQVLKDAVVCLAVLLAIVYLAWTARAELGAPADRAENYAAARPEWYFLFLFQFLKYFPGEAGKFFGAIVIPGLVMAVFFLMPFIAYHRKGHYFNLTVLAVVLIGALALTLLALEEDYYADLVDPAEFAHLDTAFDEIAIDLRKHGDESPYDKKTQAEQIALYFERNPTKGDEAADLKRYEKYHTSLSFIEAVEQAEQDARRIKELAVELDPETKQIVPRIPPTGALTLLREDPKTQGPKLFRRYCASCHDYTGPDAAAQITMVRPLVPKSGDHRPNGAPNLYRFASREWLRGLLDPEQIAKAHLDKQTWQVTDAPYFGNTAHANRDDGMVDFVKNDLSDMDQDQQTWLQNIVVALSAEAKLNWQAEADAEAKADGTITAGREAFIETFENYACSDCHIWGDIQDADDAPDLTGYGSHDWLVRFISDPTHFYGDEGNDRMPSFNPPDNPNKQQLTPEKIELIVKWLREEWDEPPVGYVAEPAG